jgi:hypothetical protein
MKFAQIIEFSTSRIDEFSAKLYDWKIKTEGGRIPQQSRIVHTRAAPVAPDRIRPMAPPYNTAIWLQPEPSASAARLGHHRRTLRGRAAMLTASALEGGGPPGPANRPATRLSWSAD